MVNFLVLLMIPSLNKKQQARQSPQISTWGGVQTSLAKESMSLDWRVGSNAVGKLAEILSVHSTHKDISPYKQVISGLTLIALMQHTSGCISKPSVIAYLLALDMHTDSYRHHRSVVVAILLFCSSLGGCMCSRSAPTSKWRHQCKKKGMKKVLCAGAKWFVQPFIIRQAQHSVFLIKVAYRIFFSFLQNSY